MSVCQSKRNFCTDCGLYNFSSQPRVPGKGNMHNPKVIIICDSPEVCEEANDVGIYYQLLVKSLGSDLDKVYITHAVKCCTLRDNLNSSSGKRKPTTQEIAWCNPLLLKELSIFNPSDTIIMTLGESSLVSISGDVKNFEKEVGKLRFVSIGGKTWTVLPNYHPSYILMGKVGASSEKEFNNIVKQAVSTNCEEEDDTIWKISTPSEAVAESKLIVEAYLDKEIKYVLYDCETSGFNPWRDKLIMYSFYAEKVNSRSIAVPLQISNTVHHDNYPYKVNMIDYDISVKDVAMINKAVGKMLETVPIAGHNLSFDIKFAVVSNICKLDNVKIHYDTLLLSQVLIGRKMFGGLSLKSLCIKLFGVPNWELPVESYIGMFRKLEDRTYDRIPTSILGEYAAKDTYYNDALLTFLQDMIEG